MINPIELLTGIAAGRAANAAIDKSQRAFQNAAGIDTGPDTNELLTHLLQAVLRLEQAYHGQSSKRENAWLSMQLYPGMHTRYPATPEFAYNSIFARSSTPISLKIPGIGDVAATLYAGWNQLNLPPETTIGLPANAPGQINIVFREAESAYSNLEQFSGQTQTGYIALVSPPASTSAGNDTPLTFAETIGQITIQNNTGVTVNYAFDAIAGPGSLALSPGQTYSESKQISALHLYTGSAQAINGSSGGNIVVLGEM